MIVVDEEGVDAVVEPVVDDEVMLDLLAVVDEDPVDAVVDPVVEELTLDRLVVAEVVGDVVE